MSADSHVDDKAPIDFFFDFSSPYGYFASCRIDEIGKRHGREVTWRPYLMGAAMKLTGSKPLVEREMIGEYSRRDIPRTARRFGIAYNPPPPPFPLASIAPCRVYYWLYDQDPASAKEFARRIYAALFVDGRNISEAEVVIDVASGAGASASETRAALADQSVKDRLRGETDAAIERGVFGSPFFLVDGEPFWGNDRIDELDRWLQTGGW
jgi:2-hydroxychromene-2-carboxylate isomerase